MRRLLGMVGVLLFGLSSVVSAACPGDCDGNPVVSIDELVTAVRIALAQAPLTVCANADSSADGRVTVDDLVRAVNAALHGCAATLTPTVTASLTATAPLTPSPSLAQPTHTPNVTASVTPTLEASASVTPSLSPEPSNSATPSVTPPATGTPTMDVSATATNTATATVTTTPTSSPTSEATTTGTRVSTSSPTRSVTPTATDVPTASATTTRTPSPTRTASPSTTPIPTQTSTATASPSATTTPTGGPLGTRRFSLDPASSAFISVLASDMQVGVAGFTGYLDLHAGAPDPQTGRAIISVTGSSPYLQLVSDTGLICIQPLNLPVAAAGIVDCDGGTNLGTLIRQDHRIGTVGMGGFTTQNCTVAGGSVEPGAFPHPQVCNGPLTVEPSADGDSGLGAVAIGPDPSFSLNGLPAQLTFEPGPQCTGQGAGFTSVLALLSSDTRTEIEHVNNTDSALVYDNPGENFWCPTWTQENGPGRLILSFPTLHGAGSADLINVFVFDD